MPELDIHASAREVADLLNCNRTAAAVDLLDELRQGQSLVVQEALDRYVAVEAREQLAALTGAGAIALHDGRDARSVLERLREAAGPPRFPEITETRRLSQAQMHDIYGSMVESRGNQGARDSLDANNQRVILGLRRETITTADNGKGNYNDRLVLVWKDHQGIRHAREFNQANTEPSAQYDHHAGSDGTRPFADRTGNAPQLQASPGYERILAKKIEGEDANSDGIRDLGRLDEGTTEMFETDHPTYGNRRRNGPEFALRPSPEAVTAGAGRVQRDTNADGWFTAADVNGVQELNNTFKIHRGSSRNTDSAGCQTIGGNEYDAFVSEVTRNPQQNRWQYVLTSVEAGQLLQQRGEVRPPAPPVPQALPAAPPRHPADPGHPDHNLHRQIQDRVGLLVPPSQDDRQQLSLSLLAEAKAHGLSWVDHLFPNQPRPTVREGENLFLVQGRADDPAAARVVVNAAIAGATPANESLDRIEKLNLALAGTTTLDQSQRISELATPRIRLG